MAIPDTIDHERELAAALNGLLDQVYQMQGMFDDSDGAIQRAVDDAEAALVRYRLGQAK